MPRVNQTVRHALASGDADECPERTASIAVLIISLFYDRDCLIVVFSTKLYSLKLAHTHPIS